MSGAASEPGLISPGSEDRATERKTTIFSRQKTYEPPLKLKQIIPQTDGPTGQMRKFETSGDGLLSLLKPAIEADVTLK